MSAESPLTNENIICFAGEDWWYHNPHSNLHLMKTFAKKNRVLFVNSIGVRTPNLKKDLFAWKRILNKLRSLARYFRKTSDGVFVLTPVALPLLPGFERAVVRLNTWLLVIQIRVISALLGFHRPIIWAALATIRDAACFLRRSFGKCLVYYCVDNISKYEGANAEYISQLDVSLQQQADIAFFVNRDMVAERRIYNPRTFHLGHGVDYDHFARVQDATTPLPEDLRDIPRPIVGNVGVLRLLDLELIRYLAERHPEVSFVFVGDMYMDVSRLRPLKNIYLLGKRPYESLPSYMKAFACCGMFYDLRNAFIQYSNPKKLMEYLATGKPVVSVAIPEVERVTDLIRLAKTYEEYERHLLDAVRDDYAEGCRERMAFAARHTWEEVAQRATAHITSFLNGEEAPPYDQADTTIAASEASLGWHTPP